MLGECLAGFRILDLSQYLPGPFSTQLLADLGAEVIKVEPPAGDPMRAFGPLDSDGVSVFYKLVNAGKQVLRLDLKNAQDRAAFLALVARADGLLESFRPGTLARLDLAAETLRAANPSLIHCALSGYGQKGPLSQQPGHDINYMAWGGGLATSGPRRKPAIAHPPTSDYAGAVNAALAITAALLRREKSGKGAFLDISMGESVLSWQAFSMTAAARKDSPMTRGDAYLNGGAASYGIYETADHRFVALGAVEEKFWTAFCQAVGRPDWIDRQDEPLPQKGLMEEVSALFAGETLAHWCRTLEPVKCCFQKVVLPEELPDDPQVQARGLVQRHAGPNPSISVACPVHFDGRRPPPRATLEEIAIAQALREWGARPATPA
jgi:crotonobetainyl-CoA:carnitine CoA-transferase CaiB-like acyl-CoA transferase